MGTCAFGAARPDLEPKAHERKDLTYPPHRMATQNHLGWLLAHSLAKGGKFGNIGNQTVIIGA